MYKTRIIASLVGGIIIFAWQFLSWTVLGIHNQDQKYLSEQQQVLDFLSSTIKEEGTYMLPGLPPDATPEQEQQLMKEMHGRPMATITYVQQFDTGMARPMIRGFLIDVFLVYLLIYIFSRGGMPSFIRIVAASISTGIFTWLWGPYTGHNWYQLPWSTISPLLIDAIVAWGLCGLWLGWYLNPGRKTTEAA